MMVQLILTGRQSKEREMCWQMVTHGEARATCCTLAASDKDNLQ